MTARPDQQDSDELARMMIEISAQKSQVSAKEPPTQRSENSVDFRYKRREAACRRRFEPLTGVPARKVNRYEICL